MRPTNTTAPRRGEIWLVQFDPKVGSEMGSPHPALVISRDDVGVLPLRTVVPVTSWQEKFSVVPWMFALNPDAPNGLKSKSAADCFQTRSLDVSRFISRWGELDSATVEQVAVVVAEVIGLAVGKE